MKNSRRSFLRSVAAWVAGVLAVACGSDPTAKFADGRIDGGVEPAPQPEPTWRPTASAAPSVEAADASPQGKTSEPSVVDETEEASPRQSADDPPDDSGANEAQVVALRVLGPDGQVLAEGEFIARPDITPLHALVVTQLRFSVTEDGYVDRIGPYGGSGIRGWHYRVGGCHPGAKAGEYLLGSARQVDWEYVPQDAGCPW